MIKSGFLRFRNRIRLHQKRMLEKLRTNRAFRVQSPDPVERKIKIQRIISDKRLKLQKEQLRRSKNLVNRLSKPKLRRTKDIVDIKLAELERPKDVLDIKLAKLRAKRFRNIWRIKKPIIRKRLYLPVSETKAKRLAVGKITGSKLPDPKPAFSSNLMLFMVFGLVAFVLLKK